VATAAPQSRADLADPQTGARDVPRGGPQDAGGAGDVGPGFRPVNELERVLARYVLTGARATLLRALARSTLCVLAEATAGLSDADAGGIRVPCVADTEGRHALVYTSFRQLALAHGLADDAPWLEVPAETLFGKWPPDVDVWLNAGAELGFPLDPTDVGTVADIAAGLEVDEAYEIGPDDEFTDFPGPSIPDQVDCAVVLALLDVPEVLEVLRVFRRLQEPRGRTWRILLVLVDADVGHVQLAQQLARRRQRRAVSRPRSQPEHGPIERRASTVTQDPATLERVLIPRR